MTEQVYVNQRSGIILTGNRAEDARRLDALYASPKVWQSPIAREVEARLAAIEVAVKGLVANAAAKEIADEEEELKPDWPSAYAGVVQDARPTFFANTAVSSLGPDEEEMPMNWPPAWRL